MDLSFGATSSIPMKRLRARDARNAAPSSMADRTLGLFQIIIFAKRAPLNSTARLESCTIYDSSRRGCDRPSDGGGRRSGTASVSAKATILIVDDELDVREVLEEYFVAHGYAAICAESASAAKAMAAEHSIDLALVDIHMPGRMA
jgi:PleD family two-component response regulator